MTKTKPEVEETTLSEEKLNISKVHIDNKTKAIDIVENVSRVTKSGKILNELGNLRNGDQPAHEDLLNCLQEFVPHFLMKLQMPGYKKFAAEYLKSKKALSDEKLEGFIILSVSIGERGLMNISGGIKDDRGSIAAVNANNISLDLESGAYLYAKELNVLWENLCEHVNDYFIDGKFGAGAQNELDLNLPPLN